MKLLINSLQINRLMPIKATAVVITTKIQETMQKLE